MTPVDTPAEPRRRPGTVTAAVALLYLVAGLEIISLILSLSILGEQRQVLDELYEGVENGDALVATQMGAAVLSLIVIGLLAVGLAVLAFLDGRGNRPARIVTWVLGGIYLCCSAGGLAGNALAGSVNTNANGAGPDPAEVAERLGEVGPAWYRSVAIAIMVVGLLSLLSALVLLALPASNAFFRKRESMEWEPPLPPPPGVPPVPGAPVPGMPAPPSGTPAPPAPPSGTPAPPAPPSGTPAPPSDAPEAPPAPPSDSPPAPPADDDRK